MPESKKKYEFKVVIEGFELAPEFVTRINQALQKVVLIEMASADFGGNDLVFTPIMGQMVSEDAARAIIGNGGSTGGAAIRAASIS
jgi:hypothetical protein